MKYNWNSVKEANGKEADSEWRTANRGTDRSCHSEPVELCSLRESLWERTPFGEYLDTARYELRRTKLSEQTALLNYLSSLFTAIRCPLFAFFSQFSELRTPGPELLLSPEA